MTTPNSTISEPYKHLTIAKAYIPRQIAPWRKRHIWVWSVSDVSSRIQVRQRYHVDRHGQLTLKQLRLSVLNEVHKNSYSGPRLTVKIATKKNKLVYFASSKLVFICQCQGKFIQIKVSVH